MNKKQKDYRKRETGLDSLFTIPTVKFILNQVIGKIQYKDSPHPC
jgi:hypothetical protein